VVRLPETWDAYLAGLSQGRRRKLRVAERRLAEAGEVRVSRADASTVHEILDALADLHAARWRDRRQPGVLSDANVRAFHHDAAEGLARRGVLRLLCLSLAGRPVAVLYGFARGDRWYSYLDGFDPALADMSPGTVLVAHAMQQAIGDGQRAFDFLRGREAYKYAWGATDEHTYRLRVAPALDAAVESSRPSPVLPPTHSATAAAPAS
jgi:CelD/BcsL family acetyltransferase involved in cellulose biosynthesis